MTQVMHWRDFGFSFRGRIGLRRNDMCPATGAEYDPRHMGSPGPAQRAPGERGTFTGDA